MKSFHISDDIILRDSGNGPVLEKKSTIGSWRREAQKTEESESPWLGPDPTSDTKARCKWCNVLLVADIIVI